MENILLEDFLLLENEDDVSAERDDLKQLLQEANLKVAVLEEQLTAAQSEIKFLREELSSTQVDLIRSRSEVKVLLEEVAACRRRPQEAGQGERFPSLLLSSLDKLFEDKQQQLWLISGIQSSIDKLDSKMEEEIKSIEGGSARGQPQETNKSIKSNQASPESNLVPKLSDLNIGTSPQLGGGGKKDSVTLHLELKKAYDFSPQSELPTKRSHQTQQTPSSLYPARTSFWTPTTPTPSHALRPSLSLHNLESKTFTEVLVPSIRPPEHEVSPQSASSPRSPRLVKFSPPPSRNEKLPRRCNSVGERTGATPCTRAAPAVTSPPGCTRIRRPAPSSPHSKSASPSPQAQPYKSFTALSRLSEISENVIFMECS